MHRKVFLDAYKLFTEAILSTDSPRAIVYKYNQSALPLQGMAVSCVRAALDGALQHNVQLT